MAAPQAHPRARAEGREETVQPPALCPQALASVQSQSPESVGVQKILITFSAEGEGQSELGHPWKKTGP